MRELVYNLQPTMYALIAFVVSFIFPQRINEEKAQKLLKHPHWTMRIILSAVLSLAVAFVVGFLFTPASDFIWINTTCIFALLFLYLVKVLMNIKKIVKD
jgi:hypothetical protein